MKKLTLFIVFICGFIFFFFIFTFSCFALNLDKLKFDFIRGDYKSAIKEGENILAEAKNSGDLDELYYFLGLSYLKDGNYLRAWDIFEIIIKEYKASRYLYAARLGIGDVHFLMGNFDKARQVYLELLGGGAKDANTPDLYYRLSQCALKLDDSINFKLYREKLAKEYPLYTEPSGSVQVLQNSSDLIYSVQVGSFSREINALNLSRQLTKKGFTAYVEKNSSGSKTAFRVKVGRLQKRKDAVVLADRLSVEGYPVKVCP